MTLNKETIKNIHHALKNTNDDILITLGYALFEEITPLSPEEITFPVIKKIAATQALPLDILDDIKNLGLMIQQTYNLAQKANQALFTALSLIIEAQEETDD